MNAWHSEKLLPRFRPGEFHPRSLDFSGGTVHTARNAKTSPLSPVDRTGLFAVETSQTNRPARLVNGARVQSSDCPQRSGHQITFSSSLVSCERRATAFRANKLQIRYGEERG